MPSYQMKCDACGYVFDRVLPFARIDEPLSQPCPFCKKKGKIRRLVAAPAICDSVVIGVTKPDRGFAEVVQKIKRANPGSTLKDY
jgi:putative FmdB family regulatory protein